MPESFLMGCRPRACGFVGGGGLVPLVAASVATGAGFYSWGRDRALGSAPTHF